MPLTNQVKDSTVMMHMPNMNLKACRSVSDSAALHTAHVQSTTQQVSQSTALRVYASEKDLPANGVYFCGMYIPKVKSSDTPSLPADATSVIAC